LKEKYEDELSLAKAKLTKAEVRVSTLENTVASKTKENAELMAICDELIQKIDRNKDQSSSSSKPLP
jgi:alpha-D-ribose 1-methylphosphonate 5-triphosphate synthase subunit PhnG